MDGYPKIKRWRGGGEKGITVMRLNKMWLIREHTFTNDF